MKKIPHDPKFDHVSMYRTDVAATFKRERARLKQIADAKAAATAEAEAIAAANVADASRKVAHLKRVAK